MIDRWLYGNYRSAPWKARVHVKSRWSLFPFSRLENLLPYQGKIIDVGCSYGHWPLYVGRVRPESVIFGYDPDQEKIKWGKKAVDFSGLSNVHLSTGSALDLPWISCHQVTIIDVLYLIPFEEQERIIWNAFNHLESNGHLLVKEMGKKPRWKYAWNWLEEWLAVRLLKITHGKQFFFRNQQEWEALLRHMGFSVSTYHLDHGYLHPHILFVGEKV